MSHPLDRPWYKFWASKTENKYFPFPLPLDVAGLDKDELDALKRMSMSKGWALFERILSGNIVRAVREMGLASELGPYHSGRARGLTEALDTMLYIDRLDLNEGDNNAR